MLLLAHRDPDAPKHKGLSYFVVPMKTPGITVPPLFNMAANLRLPEGLKAADVQDALEAISGEIMVDVAVGKAG